MTGLLTVDEAAAAAGVTTRTVRRWIAAGALLPHSTMGRRPLILASDVMRLSRRL